MTVASPKNWLKDNRCVGKTQAVIFFHYFLLLIKSIKRMKNVSNASTNMQNWNRSPHVIMYITPSSLFVRK